MFGDCQKYGLTLFNRWNRNRLGSGLLLLRRGNGSLLLRPGDGRCAVDAVAVFIQSGVLPPFGLSIAHGGGMGGCIPGAERDFHTGVTDEAAPGQSEQHIAFGVDIAFGPGERIVSALDRVFSGNTYFSMRRRM